MNYKNIAIILAGGKGSRLKSVVADRPKPMATIAGKPFLDYLLAQLTMFNYNKVIFAVGFKHEFIYSYYKNQYKSLKIEYSIEHKPLGTGGAIAKICKNNQNTSFTVLNGDSYLDIDLAALHDFHASNKADVTLSLKPMKNYDRYGSVLIDEEQKIVAFKEKQKNKSGLINAGVYRINSEIFNNYPHEAAFSFENDFLINLKNKKAFGYICDGFFIDIGIPSDYQYAQKQLPKYGYF